MMPKTILFLCTGNYYRSRYAEALFNHLAPQSELQGYAAISRGLKIDPTGLINSGPVSRHTVEATRVRDIPLDQRMPRTLTYGDLRSATLVIAVKEAEHRIMLDASFPGWSSRVVFWNVHDLDAATPDVALVEIEMLVRKLIDDLRKLG